jgi:peptide/nickel transport system substrate-binding protein
VTTANALLDAAGLVRAGRGTRELPGGAPMKFDFNVVDGWSDWVAAAGIIRENLAELGVEVSVKPLSWDGLMTTLERGRFDMGIWLGERGPTPYDFYRGQMDTALLKPVGEKAVANFHRFGSEEASRLLRRFEASSDPAEQARLGRELQRIFVDNAPSLPLFASPLWGVFNASRFTGFPSRQNPYAGAAPGQQSDTLQVLTTLQPR